MRKALLCLTLFGVAHLVHAAHVQPFSDNDNITVELSKQNYNRLFVANDAIEKAHFAKNDLSIEYEKDGGVIVDLLKTEPFSVFFKTKLGHHFSVTIKPVDELGQTVQLVPKTAVTKIAVPQTKPVTNETVTQLIKAMMSKQTPPGFRVKSVNSSYRPFNKNLSLQVSSLYENGDYTGEIITVYNHSRTPATLEEAWFQTPDTKAIALSRQTIAPRHSETLFVVKEKTHA